MASSKGMSCQGLYLMGRPSGPGAPRWPCSTASLGCMAIAACTVPGCSRAMSVDYAFDADFLGLFQQFVDAVDGYFALAFFHGFVTHGLGEGHDGCDVGVVVDDVRVFGQRLWGRGPITIAVVLAHVFQISPDWPCTAGELSFEGSNEGPPVSRHTRHLIVMVVNDHADAV